MVYVDEYLKKQARLRNPDNKESVSIPVYICYHCGMMTLMNPLVLAVVDRFDRIVNDRQTCGVYHHVST